MSNVCEIWWLDVIIVALLHDSEGFLWNRNLCLAGGIS